ncbi:MAG: hypothetical protein N2C14_26260, partial [Planctomycetales bacterium]
ELHDDKFNRVDYVRCLDFHGVPIHASTVHGFLFFLYLISINVFSQTKPIGEFLIGSNRLVNRFSGSRNAFPYGSSPSNELYRFSSALGFANLYLARKKLLKDVFPT